MKSSLPFNNRFPQAMNLSRGNFTPATFCCSMMFVFTNTMLFPAVRLADSHFRLVVDVFHLFHDYQRMKLLVFLSGTSLMKFQKATINVHALVFHKNHFHEAIVTSGTIKKKVVEIVYLLIVPDIFRFPVFPSWKSCIFDVNCAKVELG